MRSFWTALLLCLLALPASAHDLQLSGIKIDLRAGSTVVFAMSPLSTLAKAQGVPAKKMGEAEIDAAIRARLALRFDGETFEPGKAMVAVADDNLIWKAEIPRTLDHPEVLRRLYPENPQARTAVTILRDGKLTQETLLDADHPALLSGQEKPVSMASVVATYLREGIGHIFGGPDHILFVLGLLLLGGSLKALLKTVTAFTLAHSITLTLAATGVLAPSPRYVEPLIALSIVAVAVENFRAKPGRDRRPFYAFGFGLIHGFGFAGALSEVGLPQNALAPALASFNVGVEIGQAAIVLAVFPLIAWLAKKHPTVQLRTVWAGSAVIAVAGAFWFVQRIVS